MSKSNREIDISQVVNKLRSMWRARRQHHTTGKITLDLHFQDGAIVKADLTVGLRLNSPEQLDLFS